MFVCHSFFLVSLTMAIKMTGGVKISLFKFTQKTNENLGILPPKFDYSRGSIILKNCFLLASLAICFVGTSGSLFFESNSMAEYGMAFYICTTVILSIVAYLILLWQIENISDFIENSERFIAKSEY